MPRSIIAPRDLISEYITCLLYTSSDRLVHKGYSYNIGLRHERIFHKLERTEISDSVQTSDCLLYTSSSGWYWGGDEQYRILMTTYANKGDEEPSLAVGRALAVLAENNVCLLYTSRCV